MVVFMILFVVIFVVIIFLGKVLEGKSKISNYVKNFKNKEVV